MRRLINLNAFKDFFKSESTGGLILILCVAISLIIANSSLGTDFEKLLTTQLGFENSTLSLRYPIILWINDGLMAIFFLLVGLEIKRELIEGELSSIKQASLPIMAAIGGMIMPAILYSIVNKGTNTAHGWGIPMATDIAFAIAIISLLGKRIPNSLKIFLTALAIVDDLGAIIVIALFYSKELHTSYLLYAGGIFALLLLFNKLGIKNLAFYLIPGAIMWYLIHHSGVHATIAGVLTALTIPTNPTAHASPLEKLEHFLSKPVNYLIMPIFALANTNIHFENGMLSGLEEKLSIGILLGLIFGKPIGITLFSWLSVKLGLSTLPKNTKWSQIWGLGWLGGIGFTMSIFIALLSFAPVEFQTQAKFAILTSSITAGILGFITLKFLGKKNLD
ncbi:Na+/H+ antiporter NhaA [Pelobium sp.]|nr:Na+/H+ antiporter NhaA [Pelobium sp.]MDA9555377.1 Na+/H+ antiporter NhaA [Pelobium sp.]